MRPIPDRFSPDRSPFEPPTTHDLWRRTRTRGHRLAGNFEIILDKVKLEALTELIPEDTSGGHVKGVIGAFTILSEQPKGQY